MSSASNPAKEGLLCVPKNAKGMHSLDLNLDDSANIAEWTLTDKENAALESTYYEMNDRLGIAISYCEDEVISRNSIHQALEIVRQNKKSAGKNSELLLALRKLEEALSLAYQWDTYVWLFI